MRPGLYVAWQTLRADRMTRTELEELQRRRFAETVRFARQASRYYHRLYAGLPDPVEDPTVVPVVRKRDLMAHFDEWVTDPELRLERIRSELLADLSLVGTTYLGRYHVLTTSGTTGEPTVVVHDAMSWAVANVVSRLRVRRVIYTRARMWRMLRRGLRWAGVFATGGHFGGVVLVEAARRRSPLLGRRLGMFSVLQPTAELVAGLNELQPTTFSAYPSAMELLAAEQEAGRLHIRPVFALVAGETMDRAARAHVEAALDCRVVEGYAASEAPAIAMECEQRVLHVNVDWFLLEPVDEQLRPVPPGVTSHTVLVTSFANRVQPVIRYDLGDRVTWLEEPCTCGSALPAIRVEGRTDEVLVLPGAAGGPVTVLPLALGAVVEETPGVHRFQAIGRGPARLSLRIEEEPGTDREAVGRAAAERVRRFLADLGATPVEVIVEEERPHPDARSGKYRQVWSAPDRH